MQEATLVGLLIAVGSGIAIGIQSTLTNWGGRLIGPTGTGLLVNFIGGSIAGVLLLFFAGRMPALKWETVKGAAVIIAVAGAIGIAIITGVAFSLPRTGIAAGLSAIILGQMAVATVVDTLGWGGLEPIPLSPIRLAGLAVMLLATWLLLLSRGTP